MLSISGFGRTGPLKNAVGYAQTVHAFSGLSSITGYVGGRPVDPGNFWGDHIAALTGAFALLVALHHRKRTGEGQYIDLSMIEAAISLIPEAIMDYTMNHRTREPMGNRDDIMAPHGCYRCKGEDKWVTVAVSNDGEWRAFLDAIGNPEWGTDDRFSDGYKRWKNREELDKLVEQWTVNHTPYEIMGLLQKAGIASGPTLNAEELLNDPHLRERGFFIEFDHPQIGKGILPRLPWVVDNTPLGCYEPAPLMGEDNDYVFRHLLGLNKEEMHRLAKERVIY